MANGDYVSVVKYRHKKSLAIVGFFLTHLRVYFCIHYLIQEEKTLFFDLSLRSWKQLMARQGTEEESLFERKLRIIY